MAKKTEKKKFNWEYFLDTSTNKVVHCATKEEANTFKQMLHERGLKWRSGNPYTKSNIGMFEEFPDGICYTNGGKYCGLEHYNERGYEIFKFSAYDFG